MKFYDRYVGQTTANLPIHMDLGRFAVIEGGVIRDLTNVDVVKLGDFVVRESIFEETNQNVHDLLNTIAASYKKDISDVNPIIQKFNIEIKEFEELLNKEKSHLRGIVANPHTLLDKNTMKVNIGRAKRISTRSYQYLAHHSEDWEKMSLLSPKPRKILHEELIIDYTVYENILFKVFLHEAIKHLNKRIKETADISKFFMSIFGAKLICPYCGYEYEYTKEEELPPSECPHCKKDAKWIDGITTIWMDKIDRRNRLVGRAQKTDKSKDSGATNRALAALKAELVQMEHAPFLDDLPKRVSDNFTYHDTNVLNSHKHYKYLKILWLELKKLKESSEEKDPIIVQQDIMDNLRTYVETLFVYSLRQMHYMIKRKSNGIIAEHTGLPTIKVESDDYGVIYISTNNSQIRIISLGGIYDEEETKKLPENTVCFCFNDYQQTKENVKGIYYINPIDTNSIECSGQLIRKLILKQYINTINSKYEYKHSLRDFVSAINCKEILFDKQSFTYCFLDKIPQNINEFDVISDIRALPEYKQRNKRDQDVLINDISELVKDINAKCSIVQKTLVCPKCGSHYRSRDLKYLVCNCGFICDLSENKLKFFHSQKDSSYSNITSKGWGMDIIE